jgi:hypothetical protein
MPFQEIVKFLSSENCENLENFEEFKSDFDDSISKEHDIYVKFSSSVFIEKFSQIRELVMNKKQPMAGRLRNVSLSSTFIGKFSEIK